jgi:hypothetical protein
VTATTHALTLPLSRGPLRRALQAGVGVLIGLGVVAAGVAVATTQSAAPIAPGTARVIPGDAAVTVHRGTPVAAADALLRAGDTLTVERGVAGLRTTLGTIYATAGSLVAVTSGAPRITRGDALVNGKDMVVGMRAGAATINGIARVRQGLTLEVDVYRGGAVVRTATETLGIPRLRRAVVSGNGATLVTIAPLVINAADKWDRKFLGTAIELDAALNARSRGLTAQVGGDGGAVIDKVIAATGFQGLTALRDEPAGEFVVAAELASAEHLGSEAVKAALKLREEGASWGLIALEQGLHTLPATLDGIDNVVVPVSAGSVAQVPTVDAPTSAPTVRLPSAPVTTPNLTKTPVTPPTTPDVVTVQPEQDTTVVGGLVNGVGNLLGGLLGH